MKFKLIVGCFLLILSACSKDENFEFESEIQIGATDEVPIVDIEFSNLVYHFEGETFEIDDSYSKGDNSRFDEILDLPDLSTYFDGSENVKLFRNYSTFETFYKTLSTDKSEESSTTGKVNYYGYVRIYADSYYKGYSYRYSRNNPYASGPVPIYNYTYPSGGKWNDKTSSLTVYNCSATFFEHAYSNSYDGVIRGNTLTLDDKYDISKAKGYSRLKSVRLNRGGRKNWNDRISEFRINRTYSR